LQVLDPAESQALEAEIDRLRMLQLVEQGLTVGDVLPDFALPDQTGRIVTSDELLARGPLALSFFRGPWCPYCSMTVEALSEIRHTIEQLGGSLVAISPLGTEELSRLADERKLDLELLSDKGSAYAQVCGVKFEMTKDGAELYARLAARFGLQVPEQNAAGGWELPVPATYVAGRDGVIAFAFGDADWARRADPAEIVAAVQRLGQAAEAVDSDLGRGLSARSTKAFTGGE
jgi:peroxiredoxin